MSQKRKRRTFSTEKRVEILTSGLRGDRTVTDVCREYEVSEETFYQWRDELLESGPGALFEAGVPALREHPEQPPRRGGQS